MRKGRHGITFRAALLISFLLLSIQQSGSYAANSEPQLDQQLALCSDLLYAISKEDANKAALVGSAFDRSLSAGSNLNKYADLLEQSIKHIDALGGGPPIHVVDVYKNERFDSVYLIQVWYFRFEIKAYAGCARYFIPVVGWKQLFEMGDEETQLKNELDGRVFNEIKDIISK